MPGFCEKHADTWRADGTFSGKLCSLLKGVLANPGKPWPTPGKALGKFVKSSREAWPVPRDWLWIYLGICHAISGIYPRLLPGISLKMLEKSLGNARPSPWATAGNLGKFAGPLPQFPRKIVRESLGNNRASPGIHANLPALCRDFPGKSLRNAWGTPEHLPGQILGIHPGIFRGNSQESMSHLVLAKFPKDFP